MGGGYSRHGLRLANTWGELLKAWDETELLFTANRGCVLCKQMLCSGRVDALIEYKFDRRKTLHLLSGSAFSRDGDE